MAGFTVNEITLLGNVTHDPELKMSKTGNPILKFGLATNHSMKNTDGSYTDIPTFHNITVFGKSCEWLSKAIHKGEKVYVNGRLTIQDVELEGIKKRFVDVIASHVIPLTNKRTIAPDEISTRDIPNGREDVNLKDIPF